MAVRHRELRHPLLGAIMLGCLVMVSSATAKAVFEECRRCSFTLNDEELNFFDALMSSPKDLSDQLNNVKTEVVK